MSPALFEPAAGFAYAAVTFGVNLLIQSTLLIAAGLLAARLLRRKGAPVRAAILRVTLIAVVLCPLASLGLRAAGVHAISLDLPRKAAEESIFPVPLEPLSPAVGEHIQLGPAAEETTEVLRSFPFLDETRPAPRSFGAVSEPEPAPRSVTAVLVDLEILYLGLSLVWLSVSAALLLRLLIAHFQMERARRCALEAPAYFVDLCCNLADQMNARRPHLRVSPKINSPCLVGFFRPVILLPEAGADKNHLVSPEVLVHELAHLARHDVLWNLAGRILSGALFFQPLIWPLTRRIEDASDDVADDYVVRHGSDRRTYARRLLHIAESFRPASSEALAGMGVVSLKSSLGRRVQRILDTGRTLSLRTGNRVASTIGALGLVATLSAGLIGARGEKLHPDSDRMNGTTVNAVQGKGDFKDTEGWKTTLRNGITIELMGIGKYDQRRSDWWKPDRSPLARTPYANPGDINPETPTYHFAIRLQGISDPNALRCVHRLRRKADVWFGTPTDEGGETIDNMRALAVAFPPGDVPETLTLEFGVFGPAWETIASVACNPMETGTRVTSVKTPQGTAAFHEPYHSGSGTAITLGYPDPGWDKESRLVAVSRTGKEHPSDANTSTPVGDGISVTFGFDNLSLADIERFQLQTRTCEWAVFEGVPLSPKKRSDQETPTGRRVNAPGAHTTHDADPGPAETGRKRPVDEDYPYSLKGRIVDSSRKPIRGARVALMNHFRIQKGGKSGLGPAFFTDANGEFTIPDLAEGQAFLGVSAEGHKASEIWSRTDAEDLEIRLRSPSENSVIAVRLRDDEQNPVKSAPVELHLARIRPEVETTTTYAARTDAEGKVEFSIPPSGDSRQIHGLIRCDMEGCDLTYNALLADRDSRVRLILHQPDQHWAGKIVDTDGQPIAGARLHLNSMAQPQCNPYLVSDGSPWSGSELTLLAETDENGQFQLDRFSKKDLVTLTVTAAGYTRGHIAFFPEGASETVFKLEAGGRLRGKAVFQPSGEPFPAARVGIRPAQTNKQSRVLKLGPDGGFDLDDVAPGWYVPFYASLHTDETFVCVPEEFEVKAGETTDTTIQVEEGIRVRGRLIDARTKEPISLQEFRIYAHLYLDPGWARPTATNLRTDGTWELCLPEGKYELQPRGPDDEGKRFVAGKNVRVIDIREGETPEEILIEWEGGRDDRPEEKIFKEPPTMPSRAWQALRNPNAGPLLLGLAQGLGKLVELRGRRESLWTGTPGGNSVQLNITVEGDATGEIFVGFFADAAWKHYPLQIRSFPGPGKYPATNLPPGKFQIGAMMGSLPEPDALGVHHSWPDPIEIKPGEIPVVPVLLSPEFQRNAAGASGKVADGYATVEIEEGVRIGGRLFHTLTGEPVLLRDKVVVAYDYGDDFPVRETPVNDDGTWEMYLPEGVYDLRPRGFDEEKNETVEGKLIHKLIVRRAETRDDILIEWYPEWRKDFDEVYHLEEGEVLKRIPPPFIPARRIFYFTEEHHQAKLIRNPPSYYQFRWDGSLIPWESGFIEGPIRLSKVLHIIELNRFEYECQADLLELEVPGDWIYVENTSTQERIRALEQILDEELNRPVRFEQREVKRDVIAARGRYQFHPLPELPEQREVIICVDPNKEDLEGGGGSGTVNGFLRWVGDRIDQWVIDETQSSDREMSWLNHRSSKYERMANDPAKVKSLLQNLSKQTSLQFTIEQRKVPVWFVTGRGQAHPGDDPNVSVPVSGKTSEGEDGTERSFLERFRERCQINADSVSGRNVGKPDMVWIYDGDVKITIPCGEKSIIARADRVVCDLASQTLTATGNVAIGDGTYSLRSATMVYQPEEGRAHLSGGPGESLGVTLTRTLDEGRTITYQTDWLTATFGEGGIQGIDTGRGEAKFFRAEEESLAVMPSEKEDAAETVREPRLGSEPPARTIHFPEDRCMGELRMWDHGTDENPEKLGEARGTVVVPERKDIMLFMGASLFTGGKKIDSQEAFQDLSPLAELRPDDLQTLCIRGPEISDDDLVHLQGLTGLRDLQITRANITDQGLLQLEPLAGLHEIFLMNCERITDEGIANLKHLTSLRSLTLGDMSGLTGEGLEGLRSLEQLGLVDCPNLTAEGLACLERLESLQELNLGHNHPWDERIAHIRLPKSLKRLELGAMELGTAPVLDEALACLENLESLEELGLGYTGISGAALVHLKNLKSLKRLRLEATHIDDPSLAHLSELSSLEYLGLEGTQTADEGLSHLGKLTSLEEITLGSEVTDAGMQYLGNLTSLKELRLGRHITDAGLAHLTGLKALERLNLHDSQVTDAGLAYLKEMVSLEDLRLWRRPITDTGLAHLSHVGSLKALHLSGTKITNAGLVHLKKLPSLETLGLQDTQVSDEGLATIGRLLSLRKLYLCGTQITDAGLAHLGKLSSLEFLDLQDTQITGEGLRHLDGPKALKTLFLSHTQLSNENLKYLRNLTSVEWLSLGRTAITDAGLDDLKALTSLKTLGVYETELSKEGIRELREALPDCSINRMAFGSDSFGPPKPKEKQPPAENPAGQNDGSPGSN